MFKNIITFLGWVLASLLLWVGTVALIKEKLHVTIAVVIIVWGILCLPPLFVFTKKFGWMWNLCVRLVLFILVPVVLSPFISMEELSKSVEDLDLFPPTASPSAVKSPSPATSPATSSPAPLSPLSQSPLPILKPLELRNAQTYLVAEATSLMTSHSPNNAVVDLQQMKIIPKGGIFQVMESFKKNNIVWYKVNAFDDVKKPLGIGWINSITLSASPSIAAQPKPTLTVSPPSTPRNLPSPTVTLLVPSPKVSISKSVSPSPTASKPVKSPSQSIAKSRWPSHRVLTDALAGGGSRIMIETDDPNVSREQCMALVEKYLPQAKGNGQIIVYKPNTKAPWNGRVLAFCLNDLDKRGTRINDIYDW